MSTDADHPFFQRLIDAYVAELLGRGCWRPPLGTVTVNIDSWETQTSPFEFVLWPCPANPGAEWVEPRDRVDRSPACAHYDFEVKLAYVELNGSDHPAHAQRNSINWSFDVMERLWPQGSPSGRAPNLYLPGAGIAHWLPALAEVRAATIDLELHVTRREFDASRTLIGTCSFREGHLLLATKGLQFGPINAHLFRMVPPAEWVTGKQFGTPQPTPRNGRRGGARVKNTARKAKDTE
jgi:hypothetical protein